MNEAQRSRGYNERHPIRRMLIAAKQRAKRSSLPFDLTEEDIVVPVLCPALKIPLVKTKGTNGDSSPSIDRLHGDAGYTKENSRIISQRANRIKNNATLEELIDLVLWLVKEKETL